MSNLVFYRKYRPQTFAEFIGQEKIIQTLSNAIANEMISHAYLFSGPRGSGKTTLARLFAKAVNCQNRKKGQSEPCNECQSCREIMEGRSIDLMEIDAASHRGIDEMRELKEGVRFVPTKSKYKVMIIDESHQLTKEAANALLKTLEEPPSHAIFILATTEAYKMIPTIASRCQRFDFRKLTVPEILNKLENIVKKEKIKIEKPALELIALNSEGSIRDAEGLLDQIYTLYGSRDIKTADLKDLLGLVEVELVGNFVGFLLQKDSAKAISFLNETLEKGMDVEEFAKALVNYLRQAMILKIMGDSKQFFAGFTGEEMQKLKKQSDVLSEDDIKKALDLFLGAQSRIKYSSILQLPLELAIVDYCRKEK